LVSEADKHRDTDAVRKELAELRNQAETLLYTTEQAIDGYADLLEPALLESVKAEVQVLRGLLEGNGNLTEIRDAYQRLESAAFQIAESMYGGTS
jgi:molecular chaperone DnaK